MNLVPPTAAAIHKSRSEWEGGKRSPAEPKEEQKRDLFALGQQGGQKRESRQKFGPLSTKTQTGLKSTVV